MTDFQIAIVLTVIAGCAVMIASRISSEAEDTRKATERLAATKEEADSRRYEAVLEQLNAAGDYLNKLTQLADEPDEVKERRDLRREHERTRGPSLKDLPPLADSLLGRWILAHGMSIDEWVNLPETHPSRVAGGNAVINYMLGQFMPPPDPTSDAAREKESVAGTERVALDPPSPSSKPK